MRFLSQESKTGFFLRGALGNGSIDGVGFMLKHIHGFIVDLSALKRGMKAYTAELV